MPSAHRGQGCAWRSRTIKLGCITWACTCTSSHRPHRTLKAVLQPIAVPECGLFKPITAAMAAVEVIIVAADVTGVIEFRVAAGGTRATTFSSHATA